MRSRRDRHMAQGAKSRPAGDRGRSPASAGATDRDGPRRSPPTGGRTKGRRRHQGARPRRGERSAERARPVASERGGQARPQLEPNGQGERCAHAMSHKTGRQARDPTPERENATLSPEPSKSAPLRTFSSYTRARRRTMDLLLGASLETCGPVCPCFRATRNVCQGRRSCPRPC